MLTLKFPSNDPHAEEVKQELQDLSLAFRTEILSDGQPIALWEDEKSWIGITAVKKRLFELQLELKKWWYCDC